MPLLYIKMVAIESSTNGLWPSSVLSFYPFLCILFCGSCSVDPILCSVLYTPCISTTIIYLKMYNVMETVFPFHNMLHLLQIQPTHCPLLADLWPWTLLCDAVSLVVFSVVLTAVQLWHSIRSNGVVLSQSRRSRHSLQSSLYAVHQPSYSSTQAPAEQVKKSEQVL